MSKMSSFSSRVHITYVITVCHIQLQFGGISGQLRKYHLHTAFYEGTIWLHQFRHGVDGVHDFGEKLILGVRLASWEMKLQKDSWGCSVSCLQS